MYVLPLASLSFPSSSEALFGRRAPLVAEIGVGSGGFIQRLAARRPGINVLGIDRAPQSIARSYRRLMRDGASNARLFKGDAQWFVRNVVEPEGLQRVYVNFPDPWPRKKHRHRRLLQPQFLRLLASRLASGGDVLVTTDHDGYFDFVVESAREAGCYDVERRDPPGEVLETKWARKASGHHHAVLRPTGPGDIPVKDIELVDDMYHAVISGDLPDLTSFEKQTFHHRDGVVVLMDVYRPLEGAGFTFVVHVEEAGLSQDALVEVREGNDGYVVAVKRFGEPLNTRGLSAAVRLTTQWLADRGMKVIHRKY